MRGIALAERQGKALQAIRRHVKRHGMPPSRSELGKALDIGAQAGVERVLSALSKKGWVRLLPRVDRGIRLLREGVPLHDPEELPEVAAGNPMVPGDYPEPERLHDFDTLTGRFESRPSYFLEVTGDSMDLAGFKSGDVVAVREGRNPQNGDIVVARIGEDITLKRFYRRNEYSDIELQPVNTNDEHDTINIDEQTDFEISGIVVVAIIGTRREREAATFPAPAPAPPEASGQDCRLF